MLTRLEREEFMSAATEARSGSGSGKALTGGDAIAWMASQGG